MAVYSGWTSEITIYSGSVSHTEDTNICFMSVCSDLTEKFKPPDISLLTDLMSVWKLDKIQIDMSLIHKYNK